MVSIGQTSSELDKIDSDLIQNTNGVTLSDIHPFFTHENIFNSANGLDQYTSKVSDVRAFDVATKQVKEKHSKFEKDVEKYNNLMNTQPKKEPLLFGKEKVIEENLKLHREKKEAVKPEFKIDNNVLDVRTYQINSKSVKDKLNDINKENFKSAVEKGRDEKGTDKNNLTIEKEEKKSKGLGM